MLKGMECKYTTSKLITDLRIDYELTEAQAVDIINYILTDDRGSTEGASNFDHVLDYRYIYPSFRQIYSFDLNTEKLTWWEYLTMLEGCFTQECILNSVISIRGMDISSISDADSKMKLVDQKAKYRLHKNESSDDGLGKMFGMLKGVAEDGS